MRIAIVGANSFLSQALLSELSSNHDVIQVYNENQDALSNEFPRFHIQEFLKRKPIVECVFYIASYINFEESILAINKMYSSNISVLKNISDTFVNAKIIHTSSVSVYEDLQESIVENTHVNPKSSYGMSKLWAELIVNNHIGGGVNVRISSLFGEGMNSRTFLPEIIINAIIKKKICIYGDGSRMQNYVYVKEVVNMLSKTMTVKTQIPFLAVGYKSYSNLEIAYMVKEIFPETSIEYMGIDNSASFFYDNTLTKSLLDISIANNFKEQLRKTALWIQKQY